MTGCGEVHITAEQRFGLMDVQATGSVPNLRRIVVLQPYSLRCHCRQREVTDKWLLDQAPSFLYMSGRSMDELAAAIPECQVSLRYSIRSPSVTVSMSEVNAGDTL